MTPFKVYYAMRGSGRIESNEVAWISEDNEEVQFKDGGFVLLEDAFLTEEQCRRDWEARNKTAKVESDAFQRLGKILDRAAAEISEITRDLEKRK